MKAWRRSGGLGLGAAATSLTIISVECDGSNTAVVTLSGVTVLAGPGGSTLEIDADPGTWVLQLNPTTLVWDSATSTPHNAAEPWAMATTDVALTPAPAVPASGVTV